MLSPERNRKIYWVLPIAGSPYSYVCFMTSLCYCNRQIRSIGINGSDVFYDNKVVSHSARDLTNKQLLVFKKIHNCPTLYAKEGQLGTPKYFILVHRTVHDWYHYLPHTYKTRTTMCFVRRIGKVPLSVFFLNDSKIGINRIQNRFLLAVLGDRDVQVKPVKFR